MIKWAACALWEGDRRKEALQGMTVREVAEVVVPHVVATYVAILGLGAVCPEDCRA